MKKVFLLVMLVAGILFGAEAQNRSINFEQTKVWKQIVKKAKKEIMTAHMYHCVKEALEHGDPEEQIQELIDLMEKSSR